MHEDGGRAVKPGAPGGKGGAALSRLALLLRAINVGGHKQVSMQDLRRVLCEIGFEGVATLLQSGNAVFAAPARPATALAAMIQANPLLAMRNLTGRNGNTVTKLGVLLAG